ncbi:GRAS family protein RAD1 [Lactuca sativa]|uniref:GRAS family protein RAD1 n=1 Tax=Lactuca sativa TaxID=4236 RepID=UPI000CB1C705|nr:GRAS family protein RAD1 [Lactuca sativa]
MEEFNHFGFSSTNIHQHLPIRRFSQAARVEEHHQFLSDDHNSSWELLHHLDDQVYPPEMAPASADSMEEFQFVDSFFNIENIYNEDSSYNNSFFPEVVLDDTFLIPDDNGDFPMMIDMSMSSSYEDATSPEMSVQPAATVDNQDHVNVNGVDDGLQLVHLLLACAEAVGCRDTQLADSILSQIWYSANPFGDSLQRVSYCFAMGLKSRLIHLQKGTISMANNWEEGDVTREEKIEAFHLLHQTTPYISFGFMVANDAIVQAAQGKDQIHIIDLGMEHTLQWPSLIRTLASTKLIRITGILGERGETAELESEMESVVAGANSVGIEVQFRLIPGPATPAMLTRENLGIKEGESLFVNSILHLHTYVKESRGSLKTILQAIKKLGPTLLTVAEQDANHNGPFFLGRFLESLHYYSAIFDSLEARMGRNSMERMKIERNHFAEEIRNIVAYEGTERVERHERADQWRRQLGRAGFQVVAGMKDRQAMVMKSLGGGDGYTVGNDQKGNVLLGWKGRPIMLAAAWLPSSSS